MKIAAWILGIFGGLFVLSVAALGGLLIGLLYEARMRGGGVSPKAATQEVLAIALCASSQVSQNGRCVTPSAACPAPQVLQHGQCVMPPPVCVPPQELRNGQCAAPSPICAAPATLQNGRCVTARFPPTIPSTPTDPSPGAKSGPGPTVSNRKVILSWGAVSGATSYKIAVRDMISNALVVDTLAGSPGHTVSLNAGGRYRWDVDACNSVGCSTFTTPLYFRTPQGSGR